MYVTVYQFLHPVLSFIHGIYMISDELREFKDISHAKVDVNHFR